MVIFFQNCWTWLTEHKDEILVFINSATFASILATITLFIKQIKDAKTSRKNTDAINDTLANVLSNTKDVTNSKDILSSTNKTMSDIAKSVSKLEASVAEDNENFYAKLNAIIEVQSVVYSTIKDEDTRKVINSILTTAKYSCSATRTALEKQVQELKEKINTQMDAVKAIVEETTDKVQETASTVTKNITPRY